MASTWDSQRFRIFQFLRAASWLPCTSAMWFVNSTFMPRPCTRSVRQWVQESNPRNNGSCDLPTFSRSGERRRGCVAPCLLTCILSAVRSLYHTLNALQSRIPCQRRVLSLGPSRLYCPCAIRPCSTRSHGGSVVTR